MLLVGWVTLSSKERDLHTFSEHYLPCKLETYWALVRVDLGSGEEVVGFPMFCVHEYLSMLWDCGETQFSQTCFGKGGFADLQNFWQHVSAEAWYKKHPVSEDAERLSYSIPCSMFGDDARIYKEQMIVACKRLGTSVAN
jgi:hypothetical protein